ncbi:MAG: DNA-3-methyladenine glycosylase 2 family protein, partial [Alphaproteobacteria bacterium]|nr:DNA-3-methyladenine glycosylase 2 family protein [Alphaproteobacteria bacterium]
MAISANDLKADLDALAAHEPRFRAALTASGYPEPRGRARGYETLFRTIIGQQVSFKAADAIWRKLEDQLGNLADPGSVINVKDEDLRACGLSR